MRARRFAAHAAPGPGGRGVIAVPFDPDQVWGAKAGHPVGGTINGRHVRGTIAPDGSGWALTVTPMWMRDTGVAAGDDVIIELAPEGPQRDDLADDIRAALAANPAARPSRSAAKLVSVKCSKNSRGSLPAIGRPPHHWSMTEITSG
jgi:Domain of unknown function (DUF1905)